MNNRYDRIIMKPPARLLLVVHLILATFATEAAEVSFSGFGTLGYARSDQPYAYQRDIDDGGTFMRDSVLAVQMDAKLTPQWGATVQAKLAAADDDDDRWQPTLSWAFLSWRPDNEWLLRFGKLRIPTYLNSENLDVGATFDYARLPVEMYSLAPTSDFTGVSFSKTWGLESGDLSLDGYWGTAQTDLRNYVRDGIPFVIPAGPNYGGVDIESMGLVLTYSGNNSTYRLGLHKAIAKNSNGAPSPIEPVWVTLGPGVGYYEFQPGLVPSRDEVDYSPIISLGADIDLGHDIRLAGELATRRANIATGLKTLGGYVSLRRNVGHWTPYVYYARLHSDDEMLDLYQAMDQNSVPPSVYYDAAIINASQHIFADYLKAYDQHTWAIGTSYNLSPTSKIKAEWARTHVGVASSLVDSPSGGLVSDQTINVLSLSYSFVF
jgi:hypothetical protein